MIFQLFNMENRLRRLTEQLFDSTLNQRISRRKALSDLARIAGTAALSFVAGGLIGYLLAPRKEEKITKTITKTKTAYSTKTITETQTFTQTQTVTKTVTKTESLEIKIEPSIGYNATKKDLEAELKIESDDRLDKLSIEYSNPNLSDSIVLNDFRDDRVNFCLGRYPGETLVRVYGEKDGLKKEEIFSLKAFLSESEIDQSSLGRSNLQHLADFLLKDSKYCGSVPFEKLVKEFREMNEIANAIGLNQINDASAHYLKELERYLSSEDLKYQDILNGLATVLSAINAYPTIAYGNWVEDFDRAEFLINGYRAYLLSKLLREVESDVEHVYAARTMVDQIDALAKCLMVDPWEVLEYEGNKLQLWDLAKQLFQKHLKFEAGGKRASVKAKDLLKRWSNREKINNRHIYLAMREVQLPPYAIIYDVEKMMYGHDYNKEIPLDPVAKFPKKEGLNILRKFVEKYDYYNKELNEFVKNPTKKIWTGLVWESPQKHIEWYLNPNEAWNKKYFPNSTKEAYEDCYKTLFFEGSLEARIPIIMYGVSLLTRKGYEEGRVEGNILFSSYLGYPVFRVGVDYPKNTDRGDANHGEFSFILNEKDENLLYQRNKDELFIEDKYTYSLFFLWTRKPALEKDQAELGEIEDINICLPLEHHYTGPFYAGATVYWLKGGPQAKQKG